MNTNETMVYVYALPDSAALANGYCFGGGRPVQFQNLDWFNGFDGMVEDDLVGFVLQKKYVATHEKLLILSPDNDISLIVNTAQEATT